ncbi:putative holin [Ectopseudomonas mendocina]|uniref:Phage holin n=1 Tax=Ectopseudomonas mendocina TaxID=300 RepID=A0A2R3QHJ9_ECTME|nr:putative holin [Pseudomonas mendocina]AVO51226.1 hypothetical protein C7A17_00050 [Pseudomonas mendocina]
MSEPSGLVAGGLLASIAGAGWFAGIDGNAATGALCGSLIFLLSRHEFAMWKRAVYFLISLVMGYLFSPGLTEFEVWGFRPFVYSGPAAFGASLMVVTLSHAALKQRGRPDLGGGGVDG